MTAYLVVDGEWHDSAKANEYVAKFGPVLEKYGGRFVGGGQPQLLEGNWEPRRVYIFDFPTMEALRRWYDSEEYAPLHRIRVEGARTNIIAVEGPPAGR